jgi:NADH-quinone oxidoreductase subunit E
MTEGDAVRAILGKYPATSEYLLDMLHDLQAADPQNYLSKAALRAVAEYVKVSLSEVASSASFYSMLSLRPRGRHIVRLCESPPCQLMGSGSLLDALEEILGAGVGETTDDGEFTLETSSCLGVCGVAPAMMIDEELYGNLTRERLLEILESVRNGNGRR